MKYGREREIITARIKYQSTMSETTGSHSENLHLLLQTGAWESSGHHLSVLCLTAERLSAGR
jgi:hypothetical protein